MATPTPSPRSEIDALLALVQKSALAAVAEYEQSGAGTIPTLNSADKHPLDDVAGSVALKRAIQDLEGACERLCTTLAAPSHTLLNRAMSFYEAAALEVVLQAKVADVLVDHPKGLPIAKLSELTGVNSDKLGRILRLLATQHCFVEVSRDVFANNRLSLRLVTTTDTAALLSLFTRDIMPASSAMGNALLDPEYKVSPEPNKAPFIYYYKDMGINNLFDYFGKDPARGERFDRGMSGWAQLNDGFAVVSEYPWDKLPADATVADLGGGIGHVSVALVKKHPHLKVTVQDRPDQMKLASPFCAAACPAAVDEGRLTFHPWNAFAGPPLPKQDVYYLRHVAHNWPDAQVSVLLKNVESAMGPNSRFLIHDFVMPASSTRDSNTKSPFPLLANHGAGNIRRYRQDMNMLTMANAKERTLDQFIALGDATGLEFVKVWEFAENEMVEFKLKRTA